MIRIPFGFTLPALVAAAAVLSSGAASAQTAVSVQASCPGSTSYGYGYPYSSGQVSCQVTNEGQPLYSGSVIFVASASANGSSPTECDGVTAPDYTTQNFGGAPLSLNTWFSGPAGCAFTVTSGTVQPGDQIGTEQLTGGSIPAPGGTITLNALTCSDPSCGGLAGGPFNPGYGYSSAQPGCSGSSYGAYAPYQSCGYTTYQPTPTYTYAAPPPPPPTTVVVRSGTGCSSWNCDGDGDDHGSSHHHHHHDH